MSDTVIHIALAIWTSLITIIGAVMAWNWNRLVAQVDSKADKTSFDQLREEMAGRWARQDRQAEEERRRLDQKERDDRMRYEEILRRLPSPRGHHSTT